MRKRLSRKAITLLEVIVVIGIISILMAMIFPAIMRLRENADKLACQSNLRQLIIAAHNYHTQTGSFPPGCSVKLFSGKMPYASWCLHLMPYLEQDEVWNNAVNEFIREPIFFKKGSHPFRTRVMQVLICPSEEKRFSPSNKNVAFTHYLGVAGLNYVVNGGMLFIDSKMRFSNVTDGASHTIMIGERPPSEGEEMGWWYAGWGQAKTGSLDLFLGSRELNSRLCAECTQCPSGPFRFQPGGDPCDMFHFWSRHNGGANFAYVDGSVRFLKYSVDSILPALSTRSGGEAINEIDD